MEISQIRRSDIYFFYSQVNSCAAQQRTVCAYSTEPRRAEPTTIVRPVDEVRNDSPVAPKRARRGTGDPFIATCLPARACRHLSIRHSSIEAARTPVGRPLEGGQRYVDRIHEQTESGKQFVRIPIVSIETQLEMHARRIGHGLRRKERSATVTLTESDSGDSDMLPGPCTLIVRSSTSQPSVKAVL
jgi:hypothetical protein